MKWTIIFLLLSIASSYGQDTLVVQTFNFSSESRDSVIEFPTSGTFRKIIMEYGMRCHDLAVGNRDVGCREWDYSCNTIIYDSSRVDSILVDDGQGGYVYQKNSPVRYELLSFVTPYGNGLDLGPKGVMWQFDVTDYAPILMGKKRFALIGGGQNQEEMNITFKFIKGVPERNVIDILPIWPLSFGTNVVRIADDIVYEPRAVHISKSVYAVKLRSVVTGHRQKGEFTSFKHILKVDDDVEFPYNVWVDCSNVPVYPQGGTWLLDRAGWCPGDPSLLNEFWLPSEKINNGQFTLDYDIPNIRTLSEASYIINNQMVQYGRLNHQRDASIEKVIRPSNHIEFGRVNPSCYEPQFVIQNRGAEEITSLEFEYGVKGGLTQSYSWTGNLKKGELDIITVNYPSAPFNSIQGVGHFQVRIITEDEQMDNNFYSETFDVVPIFEGKKIQILLTTNLIATDNELTLVNENNEVVLEYVDLKSSRAYFEEVILTNGCYRLKLTDKSGDGLYFWFYERNGANLGRGGLSLFVDEEEVKIFEPEFGSLLQYEFIIGKVTANKDYTNGYFKVYPNPANEIITIETKDYPYYSNIQLQDIDGRIIRSVKIAQGNNNIQMDLNGLSTGIYILVWNREGRIIQEKIVIK